MKKWLDFEAPGEVDEPIDFNYKELPMATDLTIEEVLGWVNYLSGASSSEIQQYSSQVAFSASLLSLCRK